MNDNRFIHVRTIIVIITWNLILFERYECSVDACCEIHLKTSY